MPHENYGIDASAILTSTMQMIELNGVWVRTAHQLQMAKKEGLSE